MSALTSLTGDGWMDRWDGGIDGIDRWDEQMNAADS